MSAEQRLGVILLGVYAATVLFFKIAMGHTQIFSHYGFGWATLLGVLAIPATCLALNIGQRSVWTIAASTVAVVVMLGQIFLVSFASGLPGNEWVSSDSMNAFLLPAAIGAGALPLRLRASWRLFAVSVLVTFAALLIGLQVVMRGVLERRIQSTLAKGGCVAVGRSGKPTVKSASDVRLGWFVGPSSDQLWFVEEQKMHRWSYSRFGLDEQSVRPANCKASGIDRV